MGAYMYSPCIHQSPNYSFKAKRKFVAVTVKYLFRMAPLILKDIHESIFQNAKVQSSQISLRMDSFGQKVDCRHLAVLWELFT